MQVLKILENLTGFKRYAALFGLGALMTLSLPPIGFFPVLFLCVPLFIHLTFLCKSNSKRFLGGWAFGAGYFIFGLYWISAALFVDIEQWGWVLPLSVIIGPALLGLYYGFVPLLAGARIAHTKEAYVTAFIIWWGIIEYARGHLFTGFPWNLTGYTWNHVVPIMQISAITGIYGLTLLTLLWAAFPLYRKDTLLRRIGTYTFAVCLLFGIFRLYTHPQEYNGDHTVRIVQANIPQSMKWNKDEDWRNLEKHAALSLKDRPVTFVVWPETAVTADLKMFPEIAEYISMKLPQGSVGLLGNLRVTEGTDGNMRFHNSLTVLGDKGKVIDAYDKFHLVPFGEYIPWREKLNLTPLALAISGIGDFTRGTGNRTLKADGLPPFSPLICYEVIFPGAVVDRQNRPDWMVNVTNDGWYGKTAGPHQHFEIARVRAIEEGLPLVRVANTGISAIVTPLGAITTSINLGTSGSTEARLPAPLPPTIYARFGDVLFSLMLVLLLMVVGMRYVRKP